MIPYENLVAILEVVRSNPNGDPNRDGEPRQILSDRRGVITRVSINAKLRELVREKDGAAWKLFGGGLNPDHYQIANGPGTKRIISKKMSPSEANKTYQKMSDDEKLTRFWDTRCFGDMLIVPKNRFTLAGPIKLFDAVSVSPVRIVPFKISNRVGVQADKEQGMGRYSVVDYGLYVLRGVINPQWALRSRCSKDDVELFYRMLPWVYELTRSGERTDVRMLHIWRCVHKKPIGFEWKIAEALTPVRIKGDPSTPAVDRNDYRIPTSLPADLRGLLSDFRDLMTECDQPPAPKKAPISIPIPMFAPPVIFGTPVQY